MTVTLEGGCRVSDMRDGDPLVHETLRIWKQIGRATGAQAISLRVMEFAPGLSPQIRNDDCDEILYVLEATRGNADDDRSELNTARDSGCFDLMVEGQTYEVGADSGIYVRPGETFVLDNPGPNSVTVISSQCPDPDRSPTLVSLPASPSDQTADW